MRILTKYILRAHLGPFLFALGVLTGILFVNNIADRIEDELAGKGLGPSVFLEVFALSIPHIIALTLPMAVLVAVLHAFSALAADNEVTALKASGVNLLRVQIPVLVAGAVVALGMVWFNDRVLPEMNHRLAVLISDVQRKSPTLTFEEQVVNEIRAGEFGAAPYFLKAGRIDAASNRLWDVAIYDLSQPGRRRTIYADSGRMAFNRELTDLFLTLEDGVIHEVERAEPERFQRILFDRQVIRMQDVGNQLERSTASEYRSDREKSLGRLREDVARLRSELAEVRGQALEEARNAVRSALAGAPGGPLTSPRQMETLPGPGSEAQGAEGPEAAAAPAERREGAAEPRAPARLATALAQEGRAPGVRRGAGAEPDPLVRATTLRLRQHAATSAGLQARINQFLVEYHKKFAIPFACIVFVLIGAPIAVRFPRGGVGMVIAVSLVMFGIYYVGLIGGEQLADRGYITPFWAMWVTNAVFLVLGLWAVSRIGHEAATARGGGWEDLLGSLRSFLRHPLRTLKGGGAAVAEP